VHVSRLPLGAALLVALGVLVGAGALASLAAPAALQVAQRLLPAARPTPPRLSVSPLEPPQPVPDFTLEGSDRPQVRLSDFRGKYVLLLFGFTYCPDACPLTLVNLAQARRALGAQAKDVQVVMVSVDPERDTPERLREWLARFDPTFVGLRGELEQVTPIARTVGIRYQRREGTLLTGYLVAHTTETLLLDRQGQMIAVYPYDHAGDMIASDLRAFMRRPV
jgi:protein SCO1/2